MEAYSNFAKLLQFESKSFIRYTQTSIILKDETTIWVCTSANDVVRNLLVSQMRFIVLLNVHMKNLENVNLVSESSKTQFQIY